MSLLKLVRNHLIHHLSLNTNKELKCWKQYKKVWNWYTIIIDTLCVFKIKFQACKSFYKQTCPVHASFLPIIFAGSVHMLYWSPKRESLLQLVIIVHGCQQVNPQGTVLFHWQSHPFSHRSMKVTFDHQSMTISQ